MASVSTCLRSPSGLRPPLRLLESLTLASTDQGRDSLRVSWDLPNGLHFQKLALAWRSKEDLRWVTGLIVRCSDTLEYLDVSHYSQGTFTLALWCSFDLPSFVAGSGPTSDLSGASKLRCSFLAYFADSHMDRHGTRNCCAQAPRSPADLNPHPFQFIFHQCICP